MHTIKLRIEKEEDLYNGFDPEDDLLSEDVKNYIIGQLSDRTLGDAVEIRVMSSETIDKARIERAFQRWISDGERTVKKEYQKNLFQQLWMFGIGVLFIVLSLAFENKVGAVWYTVLSTIGAFSMWEAAGIWIIQNPKLRMRKKMTRTIKENTTVILDPSTPNIN